MLFVPELGHFAWCPGFGNARRLVRIFRWVAGISGGKVSVAPLMAMVADRGGRSCLITLAMARPLRSWMLCVTAPRQIRVTSQRPKNTGAHRLNQRERPA